MQKDIIKCENVEYNDLLSRRKIAKNFLEVVKTQNANVYSINAPWGSGKTWFLKFIEDECIEQSIPFIQFNVWETDYAKDPFQAILSELNNLLYKLIKLTPSNNEIQKFEKELEEIKNKANKFVQFVKTRMSINAGVINISSDNSPLAEYEDMKNAKKEFTSTLKAFVEKFDTKLVIAIDELDRCRPDYAISTLEIIKHFFNIDNIVFIIAIDKEQLNRTIHALFGNMPDTDAYLSKFVDIQYALPQNDIKVFVSSQMKTKYSIIEKSLVTLANNTVTSLNGNWGCITSRYDNLETEFCKLCIDFKLSLREIEKLCLKLSIILPMIVKNECPIALTFLIVLILLNTKHPEVYNRFKNLYILADNAEFEGKLYWGKSEFRNLYKEIYIRLNDSHSQIYENPQYKLSKKLIGYCQLIDFAENFS